MDETQRIYNDKLDFWGYFKKPIPKDHITLICFAGYGDKSMNLSSLTPMDFDRAFGIDRLTLSKEEFEEFIEKFSNYFKISLTTNVKAHLERTIKNHCGLLKETLYFIATQTKNYPFIDEHLIIELLHSESYFKVIQATRAVPSDVIFPLTKIQKDFLLDMALRDQGYSPWDFSVKTAGKQLSRIGYLTESQEMKFEIASPLIKSIIFERFINPGRNPIPPGDFSFEKLILESLKRIDPVQLEKCEFSKTADGDLCERLWQVEFYRAAKSCLPANIFINVDAGYRLDSEGYLDFYINTVVKWSIELMRFNVNVAEHIKRFHKGGEYYNFAHNHRGEVSKINFGEYSGIEKFKWKVVNFITKGKKRFIIDGLWNVEYWPEKKIFYVYDDADNLIAEINK